MEISHFIHALLEVFGIAFILYLALKLDEKYKIKKGNYKHVNNTKLLVMLEETLQIEDYEKSAKIRDEITKRKNTGKWKVKSSSN